MTDTIDFAGIRIRRRVNGSMVLDHPSGHRDVYTRPQVQAWLAEADRRIAETQADRAQLAGFIAQVEALTATVAD